MTDDKFLGLTSAAARQHAWLQDEGEKQRLHKLWRDHTGMPLQVDVTDATSASVAPGAGPEPGAGLSQWAWILSGIGLVVVLVAFFMPVGVETFNGGAYGLPSEVANIDKIAIRHMTLATGLALFVSGVILFGLNSVRAAVAVK